uniref:Leucine-rich repeat-containing N-terminal plant-type domain-containing protein n=1 Tax=Lactuca sativa TaxID=4236 RepID=A0A9R1VUA9_LACSA|nr:hypothetical protein LSAT_V11C400225650 [Lactuca sativa]
MTNSNVLIFLSLFFFFTSFASSSSYNATHKCSPQQALDLLLFKQKMSSINNSNEYLDSKCGWLGSRYHPIMMNWNKNTDCCKWDGVTCNHYTCDIIGIDLSCGMLQGTIHPNTTLFHLPRLQTLNLAYNDFTASQIPHEFGRSSNSLTHLDLSECWFTGEVSVEIFFLPKLIFLDLSSNDGLQIQPNVFNNLLQNFTHLRELSMVGVDIGWVLPTYLNISSSLQSLDLSSTGLQGKLPNNIFNLQYLEKLHLSDNIEITGPFPKVNTSYNIPLKSLDLSIANLSGEIPESLGHLKSLNYLALSSCSLVGSLPKTLVNLMHLTTLDLSFNKLNGTLPSLLFTLPLLENVFLYDNMFSGGLPLELFSCRSLKILSLWGNKFDGNINKGSNPLSSIQLANLTYLDLSNNNFTGLWDLNILLSGLPNLETLSLSYSGLIVTNNNSFSHVNPELRYLYLASCNLTVFPESLRAMKNLQRLDLSYNNIQGRIPDWAQEIGGNRLLFLDLSNNFITGLPKFRWDGLNFLYLESNQIQGPFPPSICNMRNLEVLDISNNSFSGVIPQCLGNISVSIQNLNVKSNQIQGPFPLSICNMSLLSSLELSNNSFDGVLPECLGNISSSISMVDIGNNNFHGIIPNVYEECGQLQGLILNGNRLQGEIPSSLAKCQSLMALDLGNNQLNGTFPRWLGNLPELQVLVLKSNRLHGPIETPSTVKNAFPSMKVLVLSHNYFVGLLPRKYLQNFIAMKNTEKDSTKPKYLNMGGGGGGGGGSGDLDFPKISVDYIIVDFSNNIFEGAIHGVIGSLTSLIVLDLSNNMLTGPIPSDLGNLSQIESLDLSSNQLTGEIPGRVADLTFLEFLNLSQNHLVGRIPSGSQFNTFEASSFGGNLELCGLPLPKKCEHPQETETQLEVDGDGESGFTWRVVMMGYGCGTLLGLVMGYVMLSTGRPMWFNAIADVGERMIRTRRRYVYIGK